jgi:hypothetical protein
LTPWRYKAILVPSAKRNSVHLFVWPKDVWLRFWYHLVFYNIHAPFGAICTIWGTFLCGRLDTPRIWWYNLSVDIPKGDPQLLGAPPLPGRRALAGGRSRETGGPSPSRVGENQPGLLPVAPPKFLPKLLSGGF